MTFDEFLREACADLDLAWRKYRRRSARHRLDERLRELGLDDYRAYLERLRTEPSEAAGLADLLRVTVSRFFRERGCWRDLTKIVLPALIAKRQTGSLRIWSAGCCGGEEPYTVALAWLDYLQPLHPALEVEILATDIDETSLARARQ